MAYINEADNNMQGIFDIFKKVGAVAGAGAATLFTGGAAAPLLVGATSYALSKKKKPTAQPQPQAQQPIVMMQTGTTQKSFLSNPLVVVGGLAAAGLGAFLLFGKKKKSKRGR